MFQRLMALAGKEMIQIIRDKRTLGMMIALPLLWLILFGYAFSFDVKNIKVAVIDDSGTKVGSLVANAFRTFDRFTQVDLATPDEAGVRDGLYRDRLTMGILIPKGYGDVEQAQIRVLMDGTDLFAAQTGARLLQKALEPVQDQIKAEVGAKAAAEMTKKLDEQLAQARESLLAQAPAQAKPMLQQAFSQFKPPAGLTPPTSSGPQMLPTVEILYNPDLKSANVMIPGLLGLVILFMTTLMTALGVVREREYGTMEQLVVTPIKPFELMLGKILPYFLIGAIDFAIVFGAGVGLFHLTFVGNLPVFLLLSLLLVFTTLGLGLLLSTLAQNQQQAMQLALFVILPQILLSGLIFPLNSLPTWIRYISYLLPFTHYVPIARGMFIKGQTVDMLVRPAVVLGVYAVAVLTLATIRFRKRLG